LIRFPMTVDGTSFAVRSWHCSRSNKFERHSCQKGIFHSGKETGLCSSYDSSSWVDPWLCSLRPFDTARFVTYGFFGEFLKSAGRGASLGKGLYLCLLCGARGVSPSKDPPQEDSEKR
jgi:hypothetical protein